MNEAAALVIFAIWLCGSRGLNLCFAILLYYLSYIALDYTLFNLVSFEVVSASIYYIVQSWLDVAVIAIVLTICTESIKTMSLHWAYAAIIATSLFCDSLMAVNVHDGFDWLYYLHEIRNMFSVPLDVAFALAGSGVIAKLPFNLRLRAG